MKKSENNSILKSDGNFLVILDLKCHLLNRNISIKTLFHLINFENFDNPSEENFFEFYNELKKDPISYNEQNKANILFEFISSEKNQNNSELTFKQIFFILLAKLDLYSNIDIEEKKNLLNDFLKDKRNLILEEVVNIKDDGKINIYDVFDIFIDLIIDLKEGDFSFIAFLIYRKTGDLDFISKDVLLNIF